MKWDDVKFVLAVARGQTLSAAARQLKVDQTTVGRRLAALEQAAGTKLFRRVDGRLVPTEAGEIVSTRAERVETEMLALEEQLAGADITPAGVVRLTATPILANRLLIPRWAALVETLQARGRDCRRAAEPQSHAPGRGHRGAVRTAGGRADAVQAARKDRLLDLRPGRSRRRRFALAHV